MEYNEIEINACVNGEDVRAHAPCRMHAADFLRQRLGRTGTHVGCEQGKCGMCTIQVDGVAVKSCLMLAAQLDGSDVRTVESLAAGDELSELQQAFKRHHALQCGFCTPGFLMLATTLAARGAVLSREQIRAEISGVLCRCTGYEGIVRAIDDYLHSCVVGRHEPATSGAAR
ncbi:(2Fe-2S)-binding protein [Paraburkholderia tagetis]|uniref:(2Fe-2S)-binding protein n=1 Tax=Paraburkholderia tagetis TaxID=2913261 RepID=A0A9X1RXI8_9BURK|nr:(2Fe-2S)-binding protein [Paraburkholderia tagetis]